MTAILELGTYRDHRIRRRDYEGDHGWYYNANDACRAHGKTWSEYWKNKSSKAFADVVEDDLLISRSELVVTVSGGDPTAQGTWVNEDIFLHLAQWLSPKFHLWCNRQIKAILQSKQVAHREHAEHAMSVNDLVVDIRHSHELMERTLSEVKRSNDNQERTQAMCYEMLRTLQTRSPNQVEREVNRQVCAAEGGIPECWVDASRRHKIDVVVPGKEGIEIKYWNDYKHAIGQMKVYADYMDVNLDRRIHLFWKPFDKSPPKDRQKQIERECCRAVADRVTWHKWQWHKPTESQLFLPMA